jgi:hypothetical protein
MNRYAVTASLQKTIRRLQKSLNTREIARQALVQGGDAMMIAAVGGVIYSLTPIGTPIADRCQRHIVPEGGAQCLKLQRWLQQSVESRAPMSASPHWCLWRRKRRTDRQVCRSRLRLPSSV